MKHIACVLALSTSSLFATETIYPIVDVKLRCMMQEEGIATDMNLVILDLEGVGKYQLNFAVSRLNTWTPFDQDGAVGMAKVSSIDGVYWLAWKVYRKGKTLIGKQPLEFDGDAPKFSAMHKFSWNKIMDDVLTKDAVKVSSFVQNLSLPIGQTKKALVINGDAQVHFNDGKLEGRSFITEKRNRYNIGVISDEKNQGYLDVFVRPKFSATFENVVSKELVKDEQGSIVELSFDWALSLDIDVKRTKEGDAKMDVERMKELLPWISQEALDELLSAKSFVTYKHVVGEYKDQKKLIRIPAAE